MPTIEIDLNTRIIPEDHEVFVVRPGKGYRLYEYFVDHQMILADLPFLDLKKGIAISDQPDLDRKIKRSRALRNWYRGRQEGDEPSRILDDYNVGPKDLSIGQLRAVLVAYFEKLKQGDLVIVPPSAYAYPAYVGEVTGKGTDYVRQRAPRAYGQDPLTGREVAWLTQIEKRKLPDIVLDALEKPNAIFLLAKSARSKIYEAAYGTFVDISIAGADYTARFNVSHDEAFTTSSDILLQGFFNFVASNAKAIESGQAGKSFYHAAFEDLGTFAPELKTNVNSPGFLTLISKDYSTPLVAAVMFALAVTVGPEAVTAAQNGMVLIGNSKAGPRDACTALVIEKTMAQLKLLELADDWPVACEKARLAAEKSGVTSSISITQKP